MSQLGSNEELLRLIMESDPTAVIDSIDQINAAHVEMEAKASEAIDSVTQKAEQAAAETGKKVVKEAADSSGKAADEVAKVGKAAEKAGKEGGLGIEAIGNGLSKATAPARKLVGSFTETIGIATGVAGAITFVTGALAALAIVYQKLNGSGDDSTKKTAENLETLYSKVIGADIARGKFPVFEQLEKDIAELDEQIRQTNRGYIQELLLEEVSNEGRARFFRDEKISLEKAQQLLTQKVQLRERLLKTIRDENKEQERSKESTGPQEGDELVQYYEQLIGIRKQAEAIERSLIEDPLERASQNTIAAYELAQEQIKKLGLQESEQAQALLDAIMARGELEKTQIMERMELERAADRERRDREVEAHYKRLDEIDDEAKRAQERAREIATDFGSALSGSFADDNVTRLLTTIAKGVKRTARASARR